MVLVLMLHLGVALLTEVYCGRIVMDGDARVGLTILLWGGINQSLKAKPTSGYRQALTDIGC